MTLTTHIMLQAIIGSLHTFVGYPGLELPVFAMAIIHSLLTGLNVTVAALAHRTNTDGTPQHMPFGQGTGQGTTVNVGMPATGPVAEHVAVAPGHGTEDGHGS